MKKLGLGIILTFFCCTGISTACEQWIQVANFGGLARHRCTAFSIGNKGYVGGGHINSGVSVYHEDYWQYDPGSNTWTQIADFGGGKRYHSVAFTIGEFGYVGCGEDDDDNYHNDFYRYVPNLNIWQPIANYPGNPRRGASSFVINGAGYVGTGQSHFGYEDDFYRYVPDDNSWYSIPDFLGEARSSAVGFAHNGKGYIGTGHIFGDHTKDFYEFDPGMNVWTQKADVGNIYRQDATGFVLNGKGYIATGNDVDGDLNYKDVWEYNFTTDEWIRIEDFCGEGRRYMVSFVIGNVAYAGTGTDGTNLKDFWMFNPVLSSEETASFQYHPYPNPSTDNIHFDNIPQNSLLLVYTTNGKLVFQSNPTKNQIIVEKNVIGTGQFFYSIVDEKGEVENGQLIFK